MLPCSFNFVHNFKNNFAVNFLYFINYQVTCFICVWQYKILCRKVLDCVSSSAQVLIKLNINSMLNNWKMYLYGIIKYTCVLQSNFEFMGTINFLCSETVKSYQNTLDKVNYIFVHFFMIIHLKIVQNMFV